jgi:hypothetical protein
MKKHSYIGLDVHKESISIANSIKNSPKPLENPTNNSYPNP